jgi:N6-L-threonylcarbamoyladenine synthase
VAYAKALGATLQLPVIGAHHMEGHLFATALDHAEAVPPFTALLVSGGHTMLLDVPAWGDYQLLGATRDDAAGEAFDKVAKLLGMPYPGGRHIESQAREGNPARFRFAPPMLNGGQKPGDDDYYDLSFSGLKTAVLRAVRAAEAAGTLDAERPHLARGFQDALITTLAEKTARAARAFGRTRVVLGGGVACNRALQDGVQRAIASTGRVFAPTPKLATDNAAMIARAGLWRLEHGEHSGPELNAYASLPIPGLRA